MNNRLNIPTRPPANDALAQARACLEHLAPDMDELVKAIPFGDRTKFWRLLADYAAQRAGDAVRRVAAAGHRKIKREATSRVRQLMLFVDWRSRRARKGEL